MPTINSVLSQVICFIQQAQWDVEVQNLCVMCWTPASEVRCGYRPGYNVQMHPFVQSVASMQKPLDSLLPEN